MVLAWPGWPTRTSSGRSAIAIRPARSRRTAGGSPTPKDVFFASVRPLSGFPERSMGHEDHRSREQPIVPAAAPLRRGGHQLRGLEKPRGHRGPRGRARLCIDSAPRESDSPGRGKTLGQKRLVHGEALRPNSRRVVARDDPRRGFEEADPPRRVGVVVQIQFRPPPQRRVAISKRVLERLAVPVHRFRAEGLGPVRGGAIERHLGVVAQGLDGSREGEGGRGKPVRGRVGEGDHSFAPICGSPRCFHVPAVEEEEPLSQRALQASQARPADPAFP